MVTSWKSSGMLRSGAAICTISAESCHRMKYRERERGTADTVLVVAVRSAGGAGPLDVHPIVRAVSLSPTHSHINRERERENVGYIEIRGRT